MADIHFFTSVTANYIPKARVLAKSVKRNFDHAIFHLVLSDRLPDGIDLKAEPFNSVIHISDLEIPHLDAWIFQHSLVELCTAVKGSAFEYILETYQAEKIVFLDPDIVVLHSLDELSELLDKSSIVLTPHLVAPESSYEAILDNEICALKHGVYNLGFLAIRRSPESLAFINWWRSRLLAFCYDDIPGGLFTDQRWVDLAPAFFNDIWILRDKTDNVATWNLTHRQVDLGDSQTYRIESVPVKFFHFSGFDSGDQEIMLGKYAGDNQALFQFREWYILELKKEGQQELGGLSCMYDHYSNGEKIPNAHRILYRSRIDVIQAFPTPAVVTEDGNCYYHWVKAWEKEAAVSGCDPYLLELENKLLAVQNERDSIVNSNFWKVTRPLRELAHWLKMTFS